MSLKDRIEAIRKSEEEKRFIAQENRERASQDAKEFFQPVYDAFLELEKEYGSGKCFKFTHSEFVCTLRNVGGTSRIGGGKRMLILSCSWWSKNKIEIEEIELPFGIPYVPYALAKRILKRQVDNAEQAIEFVVNYMARYID